MMSEQEINERIEHLASNMRARGLAFSDSQARQRARDIVMQEVAMQESFDKKKDDPALNPQQQRHGISQDQLKESGMLTGNELPENVPLAELLKGTRNKDKKD